MPSTSSTRYSIYSRPRLTGQGRVRDSKRVTAGEERVFEHQEAHPAPPGGGAPTHSLSRHAQPMPWSCNGRREHSRQPRRSLKSDPRNVNRSSRVWSGDQTKHGTQKYDIEMRYYHFVSHIYSQIHNRRARARTADTHAHRTTRTRLNCRTQHEHTCGNSAQNRHTHQMQREILRMGLPLGPHSSQNSPHARKKRAEDRPSTMPPRACEGGKGV